MNSGNLDDLILSIVSDDYESLELIKEECQRAFSIANPEISDTEIETAVISLCSRKLISTFLLSATEPTTVEVSISERPLTELWFYISPAGRVAARELNWLSKN